MTIFGDPLINELNSIGNIFFFSVWAVYSLKLAWREYKCYGHKWDGFLHFLMFLVGAYWAGLYIFVLMAKSGTYDAIIFGQVFVRPAFTVMAGVVCTWLLTRWRRGDRCE